jgi:hypothetical protein
MWKYDPMSRMPKNGEVWMKVNRSRWSANIIAVLE